MANDATKSIHHIVPLKTYFIIGFFLYILTGATVGISFIHLGSWNVVVALTIAAIKAILVALFFMHLLYDKKMNMIIFISGVVFLAMFIALTLFDNLYRGDIYELRSEPINKEAIIYQKQNTAGHAADSSGQHGADTDSSEAVPDSHGAGH